MNNNETTTQFLPAGQILTVTCPTGTTGTVVRNATQPGGADQSVTVIAGANLTFGPYAQTERFTINTTVGPVTWAATVFDPATIEFKAGTVTNDNASAGQIGEFITATVASGAAVSLTTATAKDVTTISLTPGDWDIDAQVDYALGGATASLFQSSASLTANTLSTQPGGSGLGTDPVSSSPFITTTLTATFSQSLTSVRCSIAATTTIHLVAAATFAAGTVAAFGTIRARRCR